MSIPDKLREYHKKLKAGVVKRTRDKNRPSATKAIKEKCKDCMGGYEDKREDCGIEKCSLWYFMPYNRIRTEKRRLKKVEKENNEINKTKITTEKTEEKYWT